MVFIFFKSAITLIVILTIISCNKEVNVPLQCSVPDTIDASTKFEIDSSINIDSLEGELSTKYANDLEIKFSESPEGQLETIANTYLYQTCQQISSTGCKDLKKSECLTLKQKLLSDAFINITTKREESIANRRLQEQQANDRARAEAETQRRARIDACVVNKKQIFEQPIAFEEGRSADQRARAEGPGLAGGRKTDTKSVCKTVGNSQLIISAVKEGPIECNTRCSATEPTYSNNNKTVCIKVSAWSESKSFGAGSWARYLLKGEYKNIASLEQLDEFRTECTSE